MDESNVTRQLAAFSSCTKAGKLQWTQDWLLVKVESVLPGPCFPSPPVGCSPVCMLV